jgi:PAS domain S-box-containing protein
LLGIINIWNDRGLFFQQFTLISSLLFVGTIILVSTQIQYEISSETLAYETETDAVLHYSIPLVSEKATIANYSGLYSLMLLQLDRDPRIARIEWSSNSGVTLAVNNPMVRSAVPDWFRSWIDLPDYHAKMPVSSGYTTYGTLGIHTSSTVSTLKIWDRFLRYIAVCLAVSIIILGTLYYSLRHNLKTLRALSVAANRIKSGDYSARIEHKGAVETRVAAGAFNEMSQKIEQLVLELNENKQQLLNQLHFSNELFNTVPTPIYYKDTDGVFLGVNSAWESFFGRKREDVIGKTVHDLYTDDEDSASLHYSKDQQLWKDSTRQIYEKSLRTPDGTLHHVLYSKAPFSLTDGSVAGLIGTLTDLTALKNIEAKMRRAFAEKITAESASNSKSTFLANMSHEIRSPLTAIIGFSEMLTDRHTTMADRVDASNTIIKAGKHLLQIINDILDLSKVEAGKLDIDHSPVDIFTLLREVSALTRMQAHEKGIDFHLDYSFPLPQIINTDPVRLKQVLLNLATNAVKFTKDGHVKIHVRFDYDTGLIYFSVIDTGIGLTTEQQERLFNPFAQADTSTTRNYGGTGLGLFLSKQLCEKLGGTISTDSEPGKGSCFTASVDAGSPGKEDFVTAPTTDSLNHPELNEHLKLQGKILLAEDNLDNQRFITMLLTRMGATVSIADNGGQTVEKALEHDFDLILMDMQMPVLDGLQATRLLREKGYAKPIVALTANAFSSDIEFCLEAGCNEFLSKPIDQVKFSETLSHYLASHSGDSLDNTPIRSSLLQTDPDFKDLIDTYIDHLPSYINDISHAFQNRDWETLDQLSHNLKGVSGNYGFLELSELAGTLMFESTKKYEDGVQATLDEIANLGKRIELGK